MKPSKFSPSADQKLAMVRKKATRVGFYKGKTAFAPAPEPAARRVGSIYKYQDSQAGHEVKPWLEAEAQLFDGVERESQMHPGSSLFRTEH
jgi:hypothetical protein